MNSMTGRGFLDTNVVVYAIDKAGSKQTGARTLLSVDPLISVQAVSAFRIGTA